MFEGCVVYKTVVAEDCNVPSGSDFLSISICTVTCKNVFVQMLLFTII